MKVFLTGHTGFKGSWMTELLLSRGYEVVGYSKEIFEGSLYSLLNQKKKLINFHHLMSFGIEPLIRKTTGQINLIV